MPSFDITSEVDHQEIRNAVDQAMREVVNRFDFKDTNPTLDLDDTSGRMTGSWDHSVSYASMGFP